MGRAEDVYKRRLKQAPEIAAYLLASCDALNEFQSYMFGSSLHGVGCDIDILIVGPRGERLSRLKQQLKVAAQELPLDVLIMEPSEVHETRFVAKVKCVALSVLASSRL